MSYRIRVTKDAEKELREFPKGIQDALVEATELLSDPFSQALHGQTKVLKGYEYIFRMEAGNRRVFYVIDSDEHVVTVIGYSRRNDLYDKSTLRTLDAIEKAERRKHGTVDDIGLE